MRLISPPSTPTIPLGLRRAGLVQGLCHELRQSGAVLGPSFGEMWGAGMCLVRAFQIPVRSRWTFALLGLDNIDAVFVPDPPFPASILTNTGNSNQKM